MRLLLAMGLLASGTTAASSQPKFAWPDGRQAAIVLTYDDAIPASDLDVAAPQLDLVQLKGTFFLMGKAVRAEDVPRWRALAASGHELGNHTVNHPCRRGTFDMPAQYNSESYSVEVLLTEIGVMNTLLMALDGKTKHAFATPCGHTTVGGQDYLAALQAAGLATFIRDPSVMPASADGPRIMGTGFVGTSGADMIAWVKQVESAGALGIVVFHGVGGDYLSVTAEAHQELLDYLAAHRRRIWTAPYSEVMSYAVRQETRSGGPGPALTATSAPSPAADALRHQEPPAGARPREWATP
jgi:peptidoglycan/xylan/chitin deacetylase (PgdA/CDA1 family)